MFEIKITLDTTARLESAVYRLAEALSGREIIDTVKADNQSAPAVVPAVAQPAPIPAPAVTPAAVQPTPVPAPAYAQPIAQPAPAPAQSAPAPVPLAQPTVPTYTKEQVARAGAELIQRDPAKSNELQGLLARFGAPYINALPDEQLGAFATALRQLGANI